MRLSIGLVFSLLSAAGALENSRHFKRQSSQGSDYELKKGPLDTPWTDKVGTNPWPEYPRPQLARSDWMNLNGVWRYQNATGGWGELDAPPFGKDLAQPVLVPFCLESALSGRYNLPCGLFFCLPLPGVMGNFTIFSWYRTTFSVPSSWKNGSRVLLNFGAVDYNATVFVNGKKVGNHVGGYWSFTFDVTDNLSSGGTNELYVRLRQATENEQIQKALE